MKSLIVLSLSLLCSSVLAGEVRSAAGKDSPDFAAGLDASWQTIEQGIYQKVLKNGERVEIGFGARGVERELDKLAATRIDVLKAQANAVDDEARERASFSLAQVDAAIAALTDKLSYARAYGSIEYDDLTAKCQGNRILATTIFDAAFTPGGAIGGSTLDVYGLGSGYIGNTTATATAANSAWTNVQSQSNVNLYAGQGLSLYADIGSDWDCTLSTSVTLVTPSCGTRTINHSIQCGQIPMN